MLTFLLYLYERRFSSEQYQIAILILIIYKTKLCLPNRHFSATVIYPSLHKFEKNEFEVVDVQIFNVLLNFEPGVVPAAENYFELLKKFHFTDVPTLKLEHFDTCDHL